MPAPAGAAVARSRAVVPGAAAASGDAPRAAVRVDAGRATSAARLQDRVPRVARASASAAGLARCGCDAATSASTTQYNVDSSALFSPRPKPGRIISV